MRLLHLLAETGYSGGELQLEHLLAHLQARGHENHLCLPADSAFAAPAAELGVRMYHLPMRRAARPWVLLPLRRLISRVAPDVLHFGCGRTLLWGGLASLGLKVPLRYTTRRIDYPIGRWWWRGGRYRRLVDLTVANCRSVRRRVVGAGVPENRVVLVHEGIAMDPWLDVRRDRKAARQRLGLPSDALVICCAATLRPRKGQRLLVDAFASLADRHPRALLVLAGSGSDLRALRLKAGATAVGERILIPGPIRPVRDLYAASDLMAMPSYHEGLSNACLEASAVGLPLVVSSVGGLPEIVEDGVTGAVVPPGDERALASALDRFLGDTALRERSGAAGQERTRSLFTAERMAEDTEALLQRWLDRD